MEQISKNRFTANNATNALNSFSVTFTIEMLKYLKAVVSGNDPICTCLSGMSNNYSVELIKIHGSETKITENLESLLLMGFANYVGEGLGATSVLKNALDVKSYIDGSTPIETGMFEGWDLIITGSSSHEEVDCVSIILKLNLENVVKKLLKITNPSQWDSLKLAEKAKIFGEIADSIYPYRFILASVKEFNTRTVTGKSVRAAILGRFIANKNIMFEYYEDLADKDIKIERYEEIISVLSV